jgi:predicted MFS family arabinose efflux permease
LARESDRNHYRATYTVLLASIAAYALLQSLVTPVLTTIQHSLHTSQSAVTLVLTGYL